jgi:hypothetical protein
MAVGPCFIHIVCGVLVNKQRTIESVVHNAPIVLQYPPQRTWAAVKRGIACTARSASRHTITCFGVFTCTHVYSEQNRIYCWFIYILVRDCTLFNTWCCVVQSVSRVHFFLCFPYCFCTAYYSYLHSTLKNFPIFLMCVLFVRFIISLMHIPYSC